MTVLVDTGVVFANHDTDPTRHERATEALDSVYDGELGSAYITNRANRF